MAFPDLANEDNRTFILRSFFRGMIDDVAKADATWLAFLKATDEVEQARLRQFLWEMTNTRIRAVALGTVAIDPVTKEATITYNATVVRVPEARYALVKAIKDRAALASVAVAAKPA